MQHIRPAQDPLQKRSLCPPKRSFQTHRRQQRQPEPPVGFLNNDSLNTTETSTEANDIIIPLERSART